MREREKTNHHKRHRNNRKGYEFSEHTKFLARQRSEGFCEYPQGCDNPHDDTVDHFTGIYLGRLLGMDQETIKGLDNAQLLCSYHDRKKTKEEVYYQKLMLDKLTRTQLVYRLKRRGYETQKAA